MDKALDAIKTELYRWAREAHEAKCRRDTDSDRRADDEGGGAPLVVEAVS